MVYFEFANSRECGTAFRRRLAIQISKTERNPRIRDVLSSPSLERSRSPEDFRLSRQVGEWIYFHFPATSRRSGAASLPGPRNLREASSTSTPCSTSRGLPSRPSRFGFPLEWAVLLLPLTAAVKRRTGGACCRSAGLPLPSEGRCFYPLLTAPVNRWLSVEHSSSPGPSLLGGAASTPSPTAPSSEENRGANRAAPRRLVGGARDVLPPPFPVKRAPGSAPQRSQRRGSTRSRRSASATSRAASSRFPASLERSCATTASSCRSAAPSSSFTIT
jgi:hypothetical protein